jgi:phosphoribosylformylglycinamidine synthase
MIVLKNLTPQAISASVDEFVNRLKSSQIVFIPGGFSAGDEPEGSGKFITAFFRNPRISETINTLLRQKDALICGICNGFQALIKLGLVPYGEIVDYSQNDAEKRDNSPEKVAKSPENAPTLTFNTIGRHQSRLVRIRVSSNLSPWLSKTTPGEIFTVPISHGEGRFICDPDMLKTLAENGQIATQYVDLEGNVSNDILFNPNGSTDAIEGITSPDGRVFGKMGHSERIGDGLYKNVGGRFDMGMFDAAVEYFKL